MPILLHELAARIVSDQKFRAWLKEDPRSALGDVGIQVPAGVKLHVYENSPVVVHLLLGGAGTIDSVASVAPNLSKVLARALNDASYKAELLENPRRAIQAVTGVELPPQPQIVIHENTDQEIAFVVPCAEPTPGELSDADLEAVAGGQGFPFSPDRLLEMLESARNQATETMTSAQIQAQMYLSQALISFGYAAGTFGGSH